MEDLTQEQKRLLVLMYKEVLSKQPALSFYEANRFEDSNSINDLFFDGQLSEDEASHLCWSLYSKDYIDCECGDDIASEIKLTDKTVICMENRFKKNLESIVSFLLQLK
jgi:hypothetical protein